MKGGRGGRFGKRRVRKVSPSDLSSGSALKQGEKFLKG